MQPTTGRRNAHPQRRLSRIALLALLLAPLGAAAAHDKAYWEALRAAHFTLRPDEPVLPLAIEAADLLGSTDAELRDGIAYEAMVAWIYKDPILDTGGLEELRTRLAANARRGLGEGESDGLLLRSFSILALSVLAATDLKRPFLSQRQFDELVDLGLAELAGERDLRGYIPGKGWGHATAHCADLLKFLARSHWLRAKQQSLIVDAVAERLRTARQVFVWGEDARLAATLTSVARRTDVDRTPFDSWFRRLAEEHDAVWTGPFDSSRYVAVRAQLNALSALAADLTADTGGEAAINIALRTLRSRAQ